MKLTLIFAIALTVAVSGLSIISRTVVIMSAESQTILGEPVVNEITWIPGWNKDVWLMRQKHGDRWDRLRIIVEKDKPHVTSVFYQFTPGAWPNRLDAIDSLATQDHMTAPCAACHVSGPRAIRPLHSGNIALTDQLTLLIWNTRIKLYGSGAVKSGHLNPSGFTRSADNLENPLPLESCARCHDKSGIRSKLTMNHLDTSLFLVAQGEMPPWPFTLTAHDQAMINILK